MRYDYKFPNHWIVIQEKNTKNFKKEENYGFVGERKVQVLGSGSTFQEDGSRIRIHFYARRI